MPSSTIDALTIQRLGDDLHAALRLWHKDESDASPLQHLFLYRVARRKASTNRQATNEVLNEALTSLATQYPEAATVLRLRFLDHKLVHGVANQLNVADSTVYKLQRDAIDSLAEIVLAQEKEAQARQQAKLAARLEPPAYVELVGVESHIEQLTTALLAEGPPWLLSIEGIGGIGKTALADALVRHLLAQAAFDDFAWVTARQVSFLGGGIRPVTKPALTSDALIAALLAQLMPDLPRTSVLSPQQALDTLRDRLRQPHLMVVDNLETVQDVESLLPALRYLAGPSKFVLTSRHSLFFEAGVRHYVVPELAQSEALKLVRQEARLHGLAELQSAGDAELSPIYETVGGNPLALRLVVGQIHAYSLDGVLADLAGVRGGKAEELFIYIYGRAWESIDLLDRTVFVAMPLVAEQGGTPKDLAAITRLDPGDVHDALETLVALNLVDCRGSLHARRYSIHNLTRRFLEHQILGLK